MRFVLCLFLVLTGLPALAQEETAPAMGARELAIRTTGLPVPRFVSIKEDKVFIRTGPGLRYPITWVYRRAALPVEIIQEFDTWRKIRGPEGEEGWIHQTLVSGQRTVLVKGEAPVEIRKTPGAEGRLIARAEPGVVARLLRCGASWCELQSDHYRGWIERKSLWGIYEGEQIK